MPARNPNCFYVRAKKTNEAPASEAFGKAMTHVKYPENINAADEKRLKELEREIFDLQIANRGKDYLIDQLKNERTGFFEKLLSANRTVGQLETKLHQLDGPKL